MPLPEGWRPTYGEQQARSLLDAYNGQAHLLTPEQQEELQHHAEAYNIPHYTGDFSLLDAIGNVAEGFVEGFTTWNPGVVDTPDNVYEGIARSVGHLIGFAPGILAGPAKLLGARRFAAAVASDKMKSIPMRGASFLEKHAKQAVRTAGKGFAGRSKAFQATKNFLKAGKTGHMLEGAFHLGAASAISSWRGGVDSMIESGMGGAVAGGMFRFIGNLSPGTSAHEKVGKALAGSMFMGLPSTMRGDTTPEQVYEYMMGAYFGGNETSWTRAKAFKEMKKMGERAKEDKEFATIMDPELMPTYDKLPEEVKPILKEEAAKAWGDPEVNREGYMAFKLLEEMGLTGRVTEEKLVEEGFKPTGEYKDGEQIYRVDPEIIRKRFKSFVTSGGAQGSDSEFARWANKMGIPTINYTFGGHAKQIRATGFQRLLSTKELDEADAHVKEAEKTIGSREVTKGTDKQKEYKKNLQRRNWYQIKWADSVYAVGEFVPAHQKKISDKEKIFVKGQTQVKGGTGLTVQMAIDNGKPVYFFNQAEGTWYKWNEGANKGLGMFTHIKKPPKPTERFAGIGTRNINPKGKQAIRSLFEEHWVPTTPISENIVKEAVKAEKQAKILELEKEIEETQELFLERKNDIALKKEQGVDTTLAELQLEKISLKSDDLVGRYNRLVNAEFHRKPIPSTLEVGEELSNKEDTDFEGQAEFEVGKKPVQFVTKHLSQITDGAPNVIEKQNKKAQLSKLVEDVLNQTDEGGNPLYSRKGSKENLSEQWADALELQLTKELKLPKGQKFLLSEEARLDMRQWMTRKNMGHLVTHLQSDGKTVKMMEKGKPGVELIPVSLSGNRKHQEEPSKRIEVVYEEAGGQTVGADGHKIPTYMVLDHVSLETDKGRQDVDLSAYRSKDELKYKIFIGNAMKDMAKKGYYPLGGKGDADRIIWTRYNPQVELMAPGQIGLEISKIAQLAKDKHSDFLTQLQQSKEEFMLSYKSSEAEYDKIFLSNLYYDLQMNGFEVSNANIKKLLTHPGFIKNSAAFNKRQQIWMNNAWSGDRTFVHERVKGFNPLNDEGNYNYAIVSDLSQAIKGMSSAEQKRFQRLVSTKNSDTSEHVDGAIIVSDKVLDIINADFGNPKSGQNKSFIVSPHSEKGALLGKYMMHKAGPEMSKLMDAEGLHMIMQESAVKQRGTRGFNEQGQSTLRRYDIENGNLNLKGAEVFRDLAPEHIMGNFGVYGNEHFIEHQRLPKQLLQLLLPTAWKPVKEDVIDSAFEDIIEKRWYGGKESNLRVTNYLDKVKEGELTPQEAAKLEREIIENIDNVGIEDIVKAMKSDYAHGLSEAIYHKILKLDKEFVANELAEGNITAEEYATYNKEVGEFHSLADRVLNAASEWATEQRNQGIDANVTSVYMHKFIRDFRVRAVQNFLLNSATKPKRENSAVGFIRPYDRALQLDLDNYNPNLKKLETRDDIFFLDKAYEGVNLTIEIGKRTENKTLKEWWSDYESSTGARKEAIEEAFEAVTVRVPMDSMSGAQVLKFRGFTGRDGHGILMHGRAMKAEGGADLDGDKSFVFFGGKNGMKPEWKEAYKTNKEEFNILQQKECVYQKLQ